MTLLLIGVSVLCSLLALTTFVGICWIAVWKLSLSKFRFFREIIIGELTSTTADAATADSDACKAAQKKLK